MSDLLLPLGLCAIGLAVLILGAELLVRGGAKLAEGWRIPPVIVGLTIVSLGTSAPELAVGIDATLKGSGAMAVGNIAGTNIVNLLLVLGLSAFLRPLKLERSTLRFDLPAMFIASATLFLLAIDGALGLLDGLILVTIGAVYSGLLLGAALKQRAAAKREEKDAPGEGRSPPRPLLHATMLIGGIVIVILGADWLVTGAVEVAEIWGVSDAFIGLTVIAIGTSAPELVTTIVSTIRRQRDIAIGNLLGSSTYNIAFVMGIISLFPADGVPVPEEVAFIDIPVLIAAVVACVPVFLIGKRVSRFEGGAFVTAYALYLAYLLTART